MGSTGIGALGLFTLAYGLPFVEANPLADGVVGDAVLASDGQVARLLDLGHELLIRRPLDLALRRLGLSPDPCPRPPHTAVPRAVTLCGRTGDEVRVTPHAETVGSSDPIFSSAMRIQSSRAVGTNHPQVLEPVVVSHSV